MDSSNIGIGARVRKLRKQQHLTQVQLGFMVGVTNKHISAIEHGKTGISIDLQILLRNALHCSMDYLLLGEEFNTIDSILPENALKLLRSSEREREIFLDYVTLYLKHH